MQISSEECRKRERDPSRVRGLDISFSIVVAKLQTTAKELREAAIALPYINAGQRRKGTFCDIVAGRLYLAYDA